MTKLNTLEEAIQALEAIPSLKPIIDNKFEDNRFPSSGFTKAWDLDILEPIKNIVLKFNEDKNYYSEDSKAQLLTKLNNLIDVLNNTIKAVEMLDTEGSAKNLEKAIELISNIDIINIPYSQDIILKNDNDIKILIEKISKIDINFDASFYINEIMIFNDEMKRIAFCYLIEYYNSLLNNTPQLIVISKLRELIVQNTQKIKLELEKEANLNQKRTLEAINNSKSELIVKAFEEKAKDLQPYLIFLNVVIVILFLLIIGIFIRNILTRPDLTTDLIYSISCVLAISSFTAYLIREKNIIANQYHSYNKSHTELKALSTYLVGIQDSKADELKINLAYKYFTGGTNDTASDNNNSNNENINQILSVIKEIKVK